MLVLRAEFFFIIILYCERTYRNVHKQYRREAIVICKRLILIILQLLQLANVLFFPVINYSTLLLCSKLGVLFVLPRILFIWHMRDFRHPWHRNKRVLLKKEKSLLKKNKIPCPSLFKFSSR